MFKQYVGSQKRQPGRQTHSKSLLPAVLMRFLTPCMSMSRSLKPVCKTQINTEICVLHTQTCRKKAQRAHTHTERKSGKSQKYPQLHAHIPISFYSLTSRFTITQPTGVINISNMENYANTPPRCGGKQLCSFSTLLQPLRRNRLLICQRSTALRKNKHHVNMVHSHIYINTHPDMQPDKKQQS